MENNEKEELSNKEKLKLTLDYFKELSLSPPIEVTNAIEDVFNENIEINNVDFFFKEGIEDLQEEMTLTNEINLNLNGKSSGEAHKVYTYFGGMDISLSEFTRLYDKEELISEVTNIDNRDRISRLLNQEEYFVNLIETTTFESETGKEGVYDIKYTLRIYCPVHEED